LDYENENDSDKNMKFINKLRALFRKEKLDAEMTEEMRVHVELQTDRNLAAGMSPGSARQAALRQFGNVASIQEQCREQRGWGWLDNWLRDLRLAVRALGRSPGFSLSVFLTLMLCTGPNAAVLSALRAFVLKAPPFTAPEQLVVVKNVGTKAGNITYGPGVPQQQDFTGQADRFAGFALFDAANTTIGEDSVPVRAAGYRVSVNLFDLLGVGPELGRFFRVEEQSDGQDKVLVLSHLFWTTHYESDPQVIGRTVRMAGEVFTIIGVAPPSLEAMFTRTDFFRPFSHGPDQLQPQRRYSDARTTMLGRLRPGVTPEAGQVQLQAIEDRFRREQAPPGLKEALEKHGMRVALEAWRSGTSVTTRGPLWMLSAGAVFVLLIGCVNVANLALSRASARRGELAIRLALGAGWGALARQLFCEVLVLAGAALLAGVALGWGTLQLINRSRIVSDRLIPSIELDGMVIVMILLVGVLIALTVGLLPLLLLRRGGLRVGETRTASAGGGVRSVGNALVVGQVALALVLLIGAGLLIRSFANVVAVKPGFDAARVVQGRIALSTAYKDPAANVALRHRVLAAVREIPGIRHAGVSSYFGVGPASSFRALPVTLRSAPRTSEESGPTAILNPVSPGFFAALGTPLLAGRDFEDADHRGNRYAGVIVDRAFAERHFPGRSALGEQLAFGAGPFPADFIWPRIVGVVERANIAGLEERDGLPVVFVPLIQGAAPGFNVVVNTDRAAADVLTDIRRKLREIDPALPLYATGTLRESLDGLLVPRRTIMTLLVVFSGLALLLAAVGLYGVLAYDVSQRTKEIGIRGAIGASRGQIVALILRQGIGKTGLGLAIGLGGAFYLTQFLGKLLFDVKGTDPLTYLGVTTLLLLVALLASWLPARRAAKVDPVVALRAE
jgi:putative ABC transport system permease protein